MSFVFATMQKDLARWRKDALQFLLFLGIPLLVGGLLTLLMDGGDGARPQGVLLLVDEDESFLSGLVAGAYSGGELGELISVEKTDLEAGTARINGGDASGLLVIPAGFGDAFLNNEPVTLTLKTNPSQTILPGIITDVTEILLDAGFYAQILFGDEISQIVGSSNAAPSDAFVAAMAVGINSKIESIAPQLFPPAIDIEIVEPPPSQPSLPLALLFLPGVILMAVMFSANGIANDYWSERDSGTLRRLVIAPGQLLAFALGKTLAASLAVAAVSGITLTIGFLYHDIDWAKLPSSLLWIALAGAAMFAWFALLQMLFSTQRSANVLSLMILFPLLMVGGSFFPLAMLPGWIATAGRASPNGFVADRLTAEFMAVDAWSFTVNDWLILGVAAITGLGLNVLRLRAGFARS